MSSRTVIVASSNDIVGGSRRSAPDWPLAHVSSWTRMGSVVPSPAEAAAPGLSHHDAGPRRDSTSVPGASADARTPPALSRLSIAEGRFASGHHAAHQPAPVLVVAVVPSANVARTEAAFGSIRP